MYMYVYVLYSYVLVDLDVAGQPWDSAHAQCMVMSLSGRKLGRVKSLPAEVVSKLKEHGILTCGVSLQLK